MMGQGYPSHDKAGGVQYIISVVETQRCYHGPDGSIACASPRCENSGLRRLDVSNPSEQKCPECAKMLRLGRFGGPQTVIPLPRWRIRVQDRSIRGPRVKLGQQLPIIAVYCLSIDELVGVVRDGAKPHDHAGWWAALCEDTQVALGVLRVRTGDVFVAI